MKVALKISILFFILLSCISCVTTSSYGSTFEPLETNNDVYTLKIYYGGPPPQWANNIDFQEGTDSALYEKALGFIKAHPEYHSYKIVNIEHSYIPSYYKYNVQFLRK